MSEEIEFGIDYKQAAKLIELASARNITIASCESFTAGLFTATLGSIPGASAVLKGGLVTYYTPMKTVLAHVSEDLIEEYGVVSAECAEAMADNTREIMGADYCVSATGNAGPTAMEGKPVGLVYCGIASEAMTVTYEYQMNLPRNELRGYAINQMINELIQMIENH